MPICPDDLRQAASAGIPSGRDLPARQPPSPRATRAPRPAGLALEHDRRRPSYVSGSSVALPCARPGVRHLAVELLGELRRLNPRIGRVGSDDGRDASRTTTAPRYPPLMPVLKAADAQFAGSAAGPRRPASRHRLIRTPWVARRSSSTSATSTYFVMATRCRAYSPLIGVHRPLPPAPSTRASGVP